MRKLTIVDLFSGAGGMSLGLEMSSTRRCYLETRFAVDADPELERVVCSNFPTADFVNYSFQDATSSSEAMALASDLGLEPGSVDILCAGPPCQPFSQAGKRALDKDGLLVFQVTSMAKATQPLVVLIENVPQFSSVAAGRLLGQVRAEFASMGYSTDHAVLSASEFGVPQRRRRFFMIAIRNDFGAAEGFFRNSVLPTHFFLEDSPARQLQLTKLQPEVTVSDAISDLPSLSAGEGTEVSDYIGPAKTMYQQMMRKKCNDLYNHVAANHSSRMVEAMSVLGPGQLPRNVPGHPVSGRAYFRAAYGRLDPDRPASTITTQTHNPGSGRFTHFSDNRVITAREAARLQGFPDRFRFFSSPSVQRRHIGNAVPPLLVKQVGTAIVSRYFSATADVWTAD